MIGRMILNTTKGNELNGVKNCSKIVGRSVDVDETKMIQMFFNRWMKLLNFVCFTISR